MRRWSRVSIHVVAACIVCHGAAWSAIVGYLPVGTAERQADVIAVARVESATVQDKTSIRIQFRLLRTIKGSPAATVITAELVASKAMVAAAVDPQNMAPKARIGTVGLWFLKADGDSFGVLPLGWGDYSWDDIFSQLPSPELPEPSVVIPGLASNGTRGYQLALAALVSAYFASHPLGRMRTVLAASLQDKDHREDSLAVAKILIASASPDQQAVGLECGLRLGSDEILPLLAEKAPALRSHRMFQMVMFALGTEYKPNGEASIAPLRRLAAAHLGGEFDAAVASALRKIGTKAIVPAMVEFLDSPDPTAQLHAAHFLSEYALFADAAGNIPALKPGQGRTVGPLMTEATQANMPSRDSTKTAQEYAAFWKSWWAENKARLGFTGP